MSLVIMLILISLYCQDIFRFFKTYLSLAWMILQEGICYYLIYLIQVISMTYLIILMIFIYYSFSILLVIIYLTCFFFFLCCFLNCLLNLNYKYCFQFSVDAINPSTYQFYLLYLRLRNPILLISNLGLPVPLYLFIYSTNFCKIIVNISRKNLLI